MYAFRALSGPSLCNMAAPAYSASVFAVVSAPGASTGDGLSSLSQPHSAANDISPKAITPTRNTRIQKSLSGASSFCSRERRVRVLVTKSRKSPRSVRSASMSAWISALVRTPSRRTTGNWGHQPCRACCNKNVATTATGRARKRRSKMLRPGLGLLWRHLPQACARYPIHASAPGGAHRFQSGSLPRIARCLRGFVLESAC